MKIHPIGAPVRLNTLTTNARSAYLTTTTNQSGGHNDGPRNIFLTRSQLQQRYGWGRTKRYQTTAHSSFPEARGG